MNTISCFEPKFSGEYQIVLIRPSKSLNYSKRQNKLQTNTLKCSEFSCTSCLLIMHDDYIKSVKTKIDYEWSLFRLFRRARIKRKKPAREKWLHEIHFFRRFFFRVVLDGLRERGTTRSLKLRCQLASVQRLTRIHWAILSKCVLSRQAIWTECSVACMYIFTGIDMPLLRWKKEINLTICSSSRLVLKVSIESGLNFVQW